MSSFLSSSSDATSHSAMSTSSIESPPPASHYQFVVAGGSYAAISAVRVICKHVIPQATARDPSFRAKITVIAPNKEAYWNVCVVRLIAEPELMDSHGDQIFYPLDETLRQHLPSAPKHTPQHELELIQGKVVSVSSDADMLTYLKLTDEGTSKTVNDFFCESITYDRLILATGASSSSPAFKLNGTSALTRAALKELQESTKKASSICIVGAGGVGVELAGELGYKYGHTKKVRLYSAFDGTLERLRHKIADEAIHKLKMLGVETVTNSRAVSAHREKIWTPQSPSSDEESFDAKTISTVKSAASQPVPPLPSQYLDSYYKEDVDDEHSTSRRARLNTPQRLSLVPRRTHDSLARASPKHHHPRSPLSRISTNSSSGSDEGATVLGQRTHRTVVSFENGYKESFDCYIPTTGNIPNSNFLPSACLDSAGYVVTDAYLRLAAHNPRGAIYVYGDLVSGGSQTIADLSESQKHTLKATLLHDLLASPHPAAPAGARYRQQFALRAYKPSPVTYYVPISRKGGVGQTAHGLPIPGFVVSLVKGKNFRLNESKNFLSN